MIGVIITNFFLILASYGFYFGIRWRREIKGHLFQKPWAVIHIITVAAVQGYLVTFYPDNIGSRVAFIFTNLTIIYGLALHTLMYKKQQYNTGEKLLVIGTIVALVLMLALPLLFFYLQDFYFILE